MLCRVIMGNVEVVLPGSKQYQPSNESFDNGVDDLQNPQNYIIWDANVHKHIYAEYVVIVKVLPVTNGTTLDTLPPSRPIFLLCCYLAKAIYLVLLQNVWSRRIACPTYLRS